MDDTQSFKICEKILYIKHLSRSRYGSTDFSRIMEWSQVDSFILPAVSWNNDLHTILCFSGGDLGDIGIHGKPYGPEHPVITPKKTTAGYLWIGSVAHLHLDSERSSINP